MHDSLPQTKKWLDAQVLAGTMSQEMADGFFAHIESISAAPPEPTADELAVMAFIERLTNRQATRPPDFDALYRRKLELDRTEGADGRRS